MPLTCWTEIPRHSSIYAGRGREEIVFGSTRRLRRENGYIRTRSRRRRRITHSSSSSSTVVHHVHAHSMRRTVIGTESHGETSYRWICSHVGHPHWAHAHHAWTNSSSSHHGVGGK